MSCNISKLNCHRLDLTVRFPPSWNAIWKASKAAYNIALVYDDDVSDDGDDDDDDDDDDDGDFEAHSGVVCRWCDQYMTMRPRHMGGS